MILDKRGVDLIAEVEGCVLHPYKDSGGIPTIGIGATVYESGLRVTMLDAPITKERAYELFLNLAAVKMAQVDSVTRDDITQGMFNALVSFCYNGGIGMLKTSTLLKKVNLLPKDPNIAGEFRKFVYAHGPDGKMIKLKGLANRREKEIAMYYS